MEKGQPDKGSSFADQGTAAHFLAEQILTGDAYPILDREIAVWSDPVTKGSGCNWTNPDPSRFKEGISSMEINFFTVDSEMAENVEHYVNLVKEYTTGGELLVEQTIDISAITGEEGAAGTSDAVVIHKDEIIIIDLKYGRGVEVNAENNEQLMIYALGALAKYEMLGDFERVRLVIIQPRVSRAPSEWSISVEQLRKFGETVLYKASLALAILDYSNVQLDELSPSEAACKWCKAKAKCPALSNHIQDAIGAEFGEITTADKTEQETIVKSLVPVADQIGTKLDAVGLVEDWCKAIRAEAERLLLNGKPVAGYKLVQGRKGARAWTDAEGVEALFKSMRLKQDEMYDFTLISPTTAEKKLKDTPKRWNRVLPLIKQTEGKPSVAPITDKRPALEMNAVEDEFGVIEDSPV